VAGTRRRFRQSPRQVGGRGRGEAIGELGGRSTLRPRPDGTRRLGRPSSPARLCANSSFIRFSSASILYACRGAVDPWGGLPSESDSRMAPMWRGTIRDGSFKRLLFASTPPASRIWGESSSFRSHGLSSSCAGLPPAPTVSSDDILALDRLPNGARASIAWTKAEMSSSSVVVPKNDAPSTLSPPSLLPALPPLLPLAAPPLALPPLSV